jgi:hypothetical protein
VLTLAAIATGAKLIGGLLLGLMALLVGTYGGGRKAGQAAADRGAAAKALQLQKEIGHADAAGPRTRAAVLDRLRDGSF